MQGYITQKAVLQFITVEFSNSKYKDHFILISGFDLRKIKVSGQPRKSPKLNHLFLGCVPANSEVSEVFLLKRRLSPTLLGGGNGWKNDLKQYSLLTWKCSKPNQQI